MITTEIDEKAVALAADFLRRLATDQTLREQFAHDKIGALRSQFATIRDMPDDQIKGIITKYEDAVDKLLAAAKSDLSEGSWSVGGDHLAAAQLVVSAASFAVAASAASSRRKTDDVLLPPA